MGASIAGRARARDGFELAYWLDGHGPRRIVLIHSLALDHSFWRPVAEKLAGIATVLTYDCRGHGRSDKPPGPYTVEQFADDLADILDAAGWMDAAVAGASMGGCVALAFAGRYASRLTALGLFDTTAWYGADAPQQWRERGEKALSSGFPALVAFQKTRWFGDAFREGHTGTVDTTVATFLANDARAYAETCRMLGAADLRGVCLPTFAFQPGSQSARKIMRRRRQWPRRCTQESEARRRRCSRAGVILPRSKCRSGLPMSFAH